ncbi:GGDEF domain-containing protein [Plantactinospora sp. CA-290183]|uniref:GGDEF domain-containing protein n=1 Tax=Plantactinospora sp. CA-290183 TaxID=3240006 RepID=UPI003D8D669B
MSTPAQIAAFLAAIAITAVITHYLIRLRASARHRTPVATAMHAHRDDLTGLGDRAGFHAALAVAGRPVALILINLDSTRAFADRFGDDTLDQLLVQTAGRLQHAASAAGGRVFRLRRDEFVVILDDRLDSAGHAVRLVKAVAERTDIHLGRHPITVTVTACAGVTSLAPHVHADRQVALVHADRAMRAAKQAGRGSTAVFDPATMLGPADGGEAR